MRSRSPEERKVNKALNKIKRAYCEEMLCEGNEVVIDRKKHSVHVISDGCVRDVAKVSLSGDITWESDISEGVRKVADSYLDESEE